MYTVVLSDQSSSLTSSSALLTNAVSPSLAIPIHSDSGTTENMFHIQPYCPGTLASCSPGRGVEMELQEEAGYKPTAQLR